LGSEKAIKNSDLIAVYQQAIRLRMSSIVFTKLPLLLSAPSGYVNQVGDEASREKGISRLLKSATKS
jgi:hypothetical protein